MKKAIEHIQQALGDVYSERELQSINRLLISKLTGYSFTEILVNKNTIFSANQRDSLLIYLEKLQKNMPIQYVLGNTEFCGLNFMVNQSVLIPRPETEELVEWIKDDIEMNSAVLDIGTGSGCIAISLKYFLSNIQMYACDISEDALLIAMENAKNNKVDINFFQMDVLSDFDLTNRWDVIVSNPPYIPQNEKSKMNKNVVDYEPEKALFVPDHTPLVFYEKTAQFALKHLKNKGKIYFETHRDYAEDCKKMLINKGFVNIELKRDIAGNLRMLRAEKEE